MPEAKQHMLTREWLREIRVANKKVISKIKESEYSDDVWHQTTQDAMLDRMTWPIEVQDYHIQHTTLCRRVAVREYREHKGAWRTRTVDHFSESWVNQATTSTWTTVCEDLATLHKLLMTYMKNGKEPQMWKQDIASAYRKVPLDVDEAEEFCGVVFSHQGKLYVSYHKAASVGAMSSVQNWHRVANLLAAIMRQEFFSPVCRFVDGFFGPMAKPARLSVCDIFTTVSSCLGFPAEEAKKEQWKSVMVVLGADVAIAWERRCARYTVS